MTGLKRSKISAGSGADTITNPSATPLISNGKNPLKNRVRFVFGDADVKCAGSSITPGRGTNEIIKANAIAMEFTSAKLSLVPSRKIKLRMGVAIAFTMVNTCATLSTSAWSTKVA